jgi:hypothetical protein
MLLLHDPPPELVTFKLLGLEEGVTPGLESGEALVQPPRDAAIEPYRFLR